MESTLREQVYNNMLAADGVDTTNVFYVEAPQDTAIDPIVVWSIITNPMNRDTLTQFDEYFLQFSVYGKDITEVETLMEAITNQWDYADQTFIDDLLGAGYQWSGQYRQHRDSFKDDADYWHNLVRYKLEVTKLPQVESIIQVGTPGSPGPFAYGMDFSAGGPIVGDWEVTFDYYCNHAVGAAGTWLLFGGVFTFCSIGVCDSNLNANLLVAGDLGGFNGGSTADGALNIDAWNTLRVTRVGDIFTLYVNALPGVPLDCTGYTLNFEAITYGGDPLSGNIYEAEKVRNLVMSPYFRLGKAEQFSGAPSVVGGPVFKIYNLGTIGGFFAHDSAIPANQFILESYK